MVNISRRTVLSLALSAPFVRAANSKLRIGITDWNLKLSAKPAAIELAAQLGFDGVQVSCGRRIEGDKLPLDSADLLAEYKRLAAQHAIPIDGTCADRLHDNGLKSDKLAVRWVSDSIRITKALDARVLLLPFFGKWALSTRDEMDYTADALRELGAEAERAGVTLGLENTISAEDNVRIMERSKSKAVLVYYDVGNSTNAGFDVVREIRWLGKERICQFHLKDNPHYLGEGSIPFPAVMAAIRETGFSGYANLETDAHANAEVGSEMKRNLEFIRKLV